MKFNTSKSWKFANHFSQEPPSRHIQYKTRSRLPSSMFNNGLARMPKMKKRNRIPALSAIRPNEKISCCCAIAAMLPITPIVSDSITYLMATGTAWSAPTCLSSRKSHRMAPRRSIPKAPNNALGRFADRIPASTGACTSVLVRACAMRAGRLAMLSGKVRGASSLVVSTR